MRTIVICSSASFYKQIISLEQDISRLGFITVVPKTAKIMQQRDDFNVDHYKTWYGDANDYGKKADLMRTHFEEIEKGDAILVANYEKHGQPNYIGPNVLMEMSLAFYLHKPIYILNEIPDKSPFEEEIKGFAPYVLHENIKNLALFP